MSFTLIGKHEKDSRNNRDGFVTAMLDLMEKDSKVMHVDCDLENCINTGKLAKAFPEQTVNAGIAEANAMGVAAGLAATGRTVFMHSFGCFASRRAFDQAFMSAAYAKLPVHVIGSDPGVCAAYNGGTHMPFEDCALYMSVPEAVVIDPVDYAQINCLTKKLAASGKFSYMRMIRKGFTTVYGDGSDFEIGKGVTLKEGKDVAIIASGIMVDEALKAQEQLAAEGISAKVIDMFTWKPLDEQLILDSAAECGAIVTAENHQVKVGLGSAVANVVIKNNPVPMEMVGVEDRFGQVGAESFLREEYGLTAAYNLEDAARKAVALSKGEPVPADMLDIDMPKAELEALIERETSKMAPTQKYYRGFFSGGTLADESMKLSIGKLGHIYSNIPLKPEDKIENPLTAEYKENTCIDFGEDEFTEGKPHPMIDLTLRCERILRDAHDPTLAILQCDCVIGYGSNANPAEELSAAIAKAKEIAASEGRYISAICSIVGTEGDPQNLTETRKQLEAAGAIVVRSNAQSTYLVHHMLDKLNGGKY